MKARNTGVIIMMLLSFLAVSCRQDPIFFIIASETAPRKPRIEGAPTNMVVFKRDYPNPDPDSDQKTITVPIMYVASGRLHWYAKASGSNVPRWDQKEYEINQPEGKIIYLAVTREYLYALCLTGHGVDTALRRIGRDGDNTAWETVASPTGSYPLIQSIYADPDEPWLIAGTRNRNAVRYAIFYLDEADDTFKMLQANMTATLSGAVCRDGAYYLCTRGNGIYKADETDLAAGAKELSDATNNRTFMGIIKLGDNSIIAVTRDGGTLFDVQDDSIARMNYNGTTDRISTGRYATGALALWERIDSVSGETTQRLLIAGIQGGLYSTSTSSYTNGYVEFDINLADGSFNTRSRRHDSGSLQSLIDGNQDRYTATIGKHPLNYLFQVPKELDENVTFFAATQTAGLWSYRNLKDGGWQWNAED